MRMKIDPLTMDVMDYAEVKMLMDMLKIEDDKAKQENNMRR